VLPFNAVLHDIHGGQWVYEQTAEHTYTRRRIQVARLAGSDAVLTSGPAAGSKIVTDGSSELFGTEAGAKANREGVGWVLAGLVGGAMGAGLVSMVAGLTIGKKKYAEVEAEMQAIRVVAENLRMEMTQAVDDDSAAFEAVMGAFKLPKDTDEQKKARDAAIIQATLNAAHIPLHVCEDAVKVMELALKCARHGNLNAVSHSMSGFAMSRAALTAAGYNVKINVNSFEDKSLGDKLLLELAELETEADKLEKEIRETMKERGGI
jgi:formiminotetrahydrofolate cyclodeaminase